MALKQVFPNNSNHEMTVEEFKEWLKQFDSDKDGRISKKELKEAIRRRGGGRLAIFKGGRVIRQADKNRNGYVDDTEIESLVDFAQKNLGIRVYPY